MRYWKPRTVKAPPLVTIQMAAYPGRDLRIWAALRCAVAAFQAQTYPNWELLITHDGPAKHVEQPTLDLLKRDYRVQWIETPEREGHFGHKWRRSTVLKHGKGELVGFTNADNYYVPTYLEWMVSELLTKKADFVYCDCVHSHKQWKAITTLPRRGKLDLGGFLVKRKLVKLVPWTDLSFSGDGAYIDALVVKSNRVCKVGGTLFVHN